MLPNVRTGWVPGPPDAWHHPQVTPRSLLAAAVGALATTAGLGLAPVPAEARPATTSAPTSSTASTARAEPIAWGRCPDPGLRQAGAQCGHLTVPLDHADPAGPAIQIAVSRILHTAKPYRGAAFANPGGPGASGLQYAQLGSAIPKGVGKTYDWYGFDPRGVGASRPALSCDPRFGNTAHAPYQPRTAEVRGYWLGKTEAYAAACGASAARALLPHVKTTDTVADLEALRVAIGQAQVTYYGFSYGTYLGQVWATLHPGSIKAMVLDGVIDASRVWYRSNLDQDYAFQKVYAKLFRWVGRHQHEFRLGRTRRQVDARVARVRRQLAEEPRGRVGAADVDDLLTIAGYGNYSWPFVAAALSDLIVDRDPRMIRSVLRSPGGPGADNGYAMYLATECTDAPWPRDWDVWAADNAAVDQDAPYIAWSNAWYNAPCRTWPVPSAPSAFAVDGAAYPGPVLLISETFDAATPFTGAKATRLRFPTSRLIEGKGGTTHSASLSGISCVDDAVARLLRNGRLPSRKVGDRPDKTCPAVPAPDLAAGGFAGRPQAAAALRPAPLLP